MPYIIKPSEVLAQRKETIPEEAFEAFNELIVEKFRGKHATVLQKDVVDKLALKLNIVDTQQIFDKGWLDIEEMYRKEGWLVEYNKPAYNEEGEPYFVFRIPNKI